MTFTQGLPERNTKAVRWRIEQAEEFRQEVERYTDAERVILADADQALLRYGPLPTPVPS